MKLFYASSTDNQPEGFLFRNARLFENVVPDAKEVVIDGDYPNIEAAYAAVDVPVSRIDKVAPAIAPPAGVETVGAIPADWRELPFTAPEGEISLKGLATEVSGRTIRSKAEAVEAIETYLSGDIDRPLEAAGGLTRRELNARLEELELPIIPDEDAAITWDRIQVAQAERGEGSEPPE